MLTIKIDIGRKSLLEIGVRRIEGEKHEPCKYDFWGNYEKFGEMFGVCSGEETVSHNYDDGVITLAMKVLERIKTKQCAVVRIEVNEIEAKKIVDILEQTEDIN